MEAVEKEKNEERRFFWEKLAGSAASFALLAIINIPAIYIM